MSGRYVIPTAQRAALLKLERAGGPVMLHASVGLILAERGIVRKVDAIRWELTERGHELIAAMNDPGLTGAKIAALYR